MAGIGAQFAAGDTPLARQQGFDRRLDLAFIGMAPLGLLAVNEVFVVDEDLEPPSP